MQKHALRVAKCGMLSCLAKRLVSVLHVSSFAGSSLPCALLLLYRHDKGQFRLPAVCSSCLGELCVGHD